MLAKPILSAVNRTAHAAGTAHAIEVKQRLLERLQALKETGATYAELMAAVEAWPNTTKGETK